MLLLVPKAIILVGAVLTAVGVFAPILHLPFVGNFTLYANRHIDVALVLSGLAGISAALACTPLYRWASLSGAMILQVVVWNLLAHKAGYQAQAGAAWTFANNPFAWLAQLWAEATSMAWGALPLFLGALTIYLGGRLVVVDEDDDPLARFVPTGRRPFRSKDPMHRIEPRL